MARTGRGEESGYILGKKIDGPIRATNTTRGMIKRLFYSELCKEGKYIKKT